MRRSSELVAGAWWSVFGIILAILLLYLMVHFILLISLGFVLALIGIDGGERDLVEIIRSLVWEEHSPKELYHLLHIINTAIATLTLPIVGIGITLLYFDRRIRKEGFDIEMRVTHNLV